MSSKIYFYNENCFDTINKIIHSKNNLKMNVILTSPPYNTSRVDNYTKNQDAYNIRYDNYEDNKTDEELEVLSRLMKAISELQDEN